ncbi:AAA family ATPase [Nonomuraea sp. SBT364]|uniref:AAA family ATPase n=1 Tax=Nonomuraea sp. SBT364 TaxID=1580530 RepID=UPI000AC88201|nr:MoxR family ATPase [Nonomuraea sp. SBT364]
MDALATAVAANLPVILWGPPGTGKTSAVQALGRRLGLPVEVVVGSVREPSDFAGLPVIRDGGTWFAPPRWAERLAGAGHGILFLDELTTAPPAVQAAMLRVVLERAVGDLTLPPAVRVVAAANPPEQAADGWDLTAPLANRFVHLEWRISAASVADGFTGGFPARRDPRRRGPAVRGRGLGRRGCGAVGAAAGGRGRRAGVQGARLQRGRGRRDGADRRRAAGRLVGRRPDGGGGGLVRGRVRAGGGRGPARRRRLGRAGVGPARPSLVPGL